MMKRAMTNTLVRWRAVGRRLRVTRSALGITEQKVAEAFGVSLRTYRRYESGRRQRSAAPAVNFARRYDVSLDWIFDGDTDRIGHHLTRGKIAILPARRRWR
jgi:transcriptional regulator with XRE-family HTH domain